VNELLAKHLPAPLKEGARLWIGGEWSTSRSGDHFSSINPADGSELTTVSTGASADIDDAVQAAKDAAPAWRDMDTIERGRILRRASEIVRERWESFGVLDTLDAGRPIRDTGKRSTAGVGRMFDFYAGLTDKLRGNTLRIGSGLDGRIDYEPYGVIGAISPWNYPLSNAATKIAPALACGNTVVLKPAEQAPLSALLLAQCLHEAGLPAGVLNIVPGFGNDAGAALVEHPDVRKISFTGSTQTGRQISATAGRLLKSVTLELGGKSANIVFADADLEVAARATIFTAFNNNGQTCTAGTRLLVHKSVAPRLLELMRAETAKLSLGNPLRETTHLGPLISQVQRDRVARMVSSLEQADGRLEEMPLASFEPLAGGAFFRPMVVHDIAHDHRLWQEEIFGPVLCITTFEDDAEALELANGSRYGLSANLWTNDLRRVEFMRDRLSAGLIWVNCAHTLHPAIPVAGHGDSGVGLEYGIESMQQYMKTKAAVTMTGSWASPFLS
jgi:acyl-CoA reductase-like NAD-dependent aldehyde dehydrogenase